MGSTTATGSMARVRQLADPHHHLSSVVWLFHPCATSPYTNTTSSCISFLYPHSSVKDIATSRPRNTTAPVHPLFGVGKITRSLNWLARSSADPHFLQVNRRQRVSQLTPAFLIRATSRRNDITGNQNYVGFAQLRLRLLWRLRKEH